MDTKKAQWAIEQVAQNHGITAQEVTREIEAAITIARENPATQATWKALTGGKEIRTAAELIALFTEA